MSPGVYYTDVSEGHDTAIFYLSQEKRQHDPFIEFLKLVEVSMAVTCIWEFLDLNLVRGCSKQSLDILHVSFITWFILRIKKNVDDTFL